MSGDGRLQLVRDCFRAFAEADRELIERVLADDLAFSSPPDPALDRAGYFARCWPGAGSVTGFDLVRLAEAGDDVVATYEATRADGSRFRNTEVFGFDGDRIGRIEVYFGWELGGSGTP
jgi:ketosteroid isomerase-like protein